MNISDLLNTKIEIELNPSESQDVEDIIELRPNSAVGIEDIEWDEICQDYETDHDLGNILLYYCANKADDTEYIINFIINYNKDNLLIKYENKLSPLFVAILSNNWIATEALLPFYNDYDNSIIDDVSPLTLAAAKGATEIIDFLIKNRKITDEDYIRSLKIAKEFKQIEAENILNRSIPPQLLEKEYQRSDDQKEKYKIMSSSDSQEYYSETEQKEYVNYDNSYNSNTGNFESSDYERNAHPIYESQKQNKQTLDEESSRDSQEFNSDTSQMNSEKETEQKEYINDDITDSYNSNSDNSESSDYERNVHPNDESQESDEELSSDRSDCFSEDELESLCTSIYKKAEKTPESEKLKYAIYKSKLGIQTHLRVPNDTSLLFYAQRWKILDHIITRISEYYAEDNPDKSIEDIRKEVINDAVFEVEEKVKFVSYCIAKMTNEYTRKVIDIGPDLNYYDCDGNTPLIEAIELSNEDNHKEEIIPNLIKNGADLEIADKKNGQSPLMHAILKKNKTIAQMLIKAGANINAKDKTGNTSLHYSVINNLSEMTKFLLEAKCDSSIKNDSNKTALMIAFENNNTNKLKEFFDAGIDINTKYEDGKTLLHMAAENESIKMTEFLLGCGADAWIKDDQNRIPKDISNNEELKARLDSYKVIDQIKFSKVIRGNGKAIKVNPSFFNKDKPEILILAAKLNRIDVIEEVLASGANINYQNSKGKTALIISIKHNREDIVDLLLSKGANVNIPNKVKNEALHIAVLNNNLKYVQKLIKFGANLDSTNLNSLSPLMIAVDRGYLDIADELVESGASITLRFKNGDNKGLNIFAVSIWKGYEDLTLHIVNKGADVNQYSAIEAEIKPLHMASREGLTRLIEELLKRGADINATAKDGVSSLVYSVIGNKPEALKILIKHGANVNAPFGNRSVLDFANFQGFRECAQILTENGAISFINEHPLTIFHSMKSAEDAYSYTQYFLIERSIHPKIIGEFLHIELILMKFYKAAKLFIEYGADVNTWSDDNISPLGAACFIGSIEMVKYLCSHGAIIYLPSDTENIIKSPYQNAIASESDDSTTCEIIKFLYSRSPQKNEEFLLKCYEKGKIQTMEFLLSKGYNPNGITFLTAVYESNLEFVKLFCKYGANPQLSANNEKIDFLNYSITYSKFDTVKVLIEASTNLNYSFYGRVPLTDAIKQRKIDVVKLLIEHGADVNFHEIDNEKTPLAVAIDCNFPEAAQLLIESGADIANGKIVTNVLQNYASYCHADEIARMIEIAIYEQSKNLNILKDSKENHIWKVNLCISHGDDINARDSEGTTPLIYAGINCNLEMIQLLVQSKADINSANSNMVTPLLAAAGSKHIDSSNCVNYLCQHGANINAKDKEGNTALMRAIAVNSPISCKILIEHGSSILTCNNAGTNALVLAMKMKNTEIEKLLRSSLTSKIDIGSSDPLLSLKDDLFSAIRNGKLPLIQMILFSHKDALNWTGSSGEAPITIAYQSKNPEVITYIESEMAKSK